jgi:hypothetical protein
MSLKIVSPTCQLNQKPKFGCVLKNGTAMLHIPIKNIRDLKCDFSYRNLDYQVFAMRGQTFVQGNTL